MFQHILVPLDGSERAERALPGAARIARATGGSITLLRGNAVPVVLDQAERLRVDLIVMASHGRAGLNAKFSGSVAARITGRTSCPLLLLVRAGTPVDAGT